MKKFLIAVALVFVGFTSSLFSFEWGGLINNMTNLSTRTFKDIGVTQSNGAFFWLKSSLNKEKTMNIASEALYKYTLNVRDSVTTFSNVVDLNLLKFSGSFGIGDQTLLLDVGRFAKGDIAGAYYSQNSDGLSLRLQNMNWNIGLYGGYTGFLNSLNVYMTDIETDASQNTQFYNKCYAYVPIMLDFNLTNLGENSLGFQASYFLDLNKKHNDKAYFDIVARGPISNIGSYMASMVVGTKNFNNIMLYSGFDLSFYITNNILTSFGVEYEAGDNGVFNKFEKISFKNLQGNCQSYLDGKDLIVPRLTGVFFFNGICLTANETLYTSIPNGKFTFNGVDSSLSAVYNIFSDLQVSCVLDIYADFVDPVFNNFSILLNASFTF